MNNIDANEIDSPFQPFINRMNNDLSTWIDKQKQLRELLKDYQDTLVYLETNFQNSLMINHGENVLSKAKPINDKIVIRVKHDILVEMSQKQAISTVKSLLGLYEGKVQTCQQQIAKIMSSMREVQELISQYQKLPTN